MGPACTDSGVTWIAAGIAPDAPLMRPSVTSATAYPRFWRTPSEGVRACSSGMPFALGPCSRMTTTTSRSSSRRENACRNPTWSVKTRAGASTTRSFSATADTLMTAWPSVPRSTRRPPSGANGSVGGRSTSGSPDEGAASTNRSSPSTSSGRWV